MKINKEISDNSKPITYKQCSLYYHIYSYCGLFFKYEFTDRNKYQDN